MFASFRNTDSAPAFFAVKRLRVQASIGRSGLYLT
jgi:hypothetical protein